MDTSSGRLNMECEMIFFSDPLPALWGVKSLWGRASSITFVSSLMWAIDPWPWLKTTWEVQKSLKKKLAIESRIFFCNPGNGLSHVPSTRWQATFSCWWSAGRCSTSRQLTLLKAHLQHGLIKRAFHHHFAALCLLGLHHMLSLSALYTLCFFFFKKKASLAECISLKKAVERLQYTHGRPPYGLSFSSNHNLSCQLLLMILDPLGILPAMSDRYVVCLMAASFF